MITGVVLAAGEGRRFGGGKQLAPLEGRPLLEHALTAAAQAELDPRLVVLGANAERILATVDLHGHEVVLCPDWREGLAASLRAGVSAARTTGAEAILITLGDQPRVGAEAIARVLAARGGPEGVSDAVRASYDGVPGHPALLERSLFDALLALRGDEGARGVFKSANTHLVPCDDVAVPTDVDVIGDLATLRESLAVIQPGPDRGASELDLSREEEK
jgi:CTP:molybdopterin cytidylyltransferase MocA